MTPKERELVIYIRRQAVSAVKMANMLLEEDSRASKALRKVPPKDKKAPSVLTLDTE